MRSYLVGRKQYVRYNGTTSSTTVMKYGVPQGSVLGPLYFILYTADAFQIAGELGFFIHGYADDLQIYDHCLACDTSLLTNRLIHCIEVIGRWMSSNRLRLNASKTEFIWLGSTRRLARCTFDPIIINGDTIPPSLTVRDLGAYIDSWHQFRWTRDQADKNVLFPHTPTSVHPSVAYHRVLTRFGEGFGPIATRLLQRASWRGTEVSPRPVVWCLTGCCTFDPASPSLGQCDWSNSHWAPLAGHSVESCVQAVRACLPMYPLVCSILSRPFLHTGQCNRWTFATSFCVDGCGYLCRGHTLWQLVRGHSLYPPPLLGTDFRWIFVIPAIVFSLSGKNWRLICSMRLFKPIC